ncbi:MAG: pyrroloquinoline quinone-dependent dehydrogenase [Acidobacteriota bacterium]|nr:pyrroloquinoline quinone-dependent dehydrogenase [Acidobacteriota bacterium]
MHVLKIAAAAVTLSLLASAQTTGWTHYGSDPGGSRYSPLKQITPGNVDKLKVAWTYHTGALLPETPRNRQAAFEATPILLDGTLYLSTPYNQVIALDPVTGAERWKYDPKVDRTHGYSEVTSRGVSAWTSNTGSRIVMGTIDARLIALDAKTGKLVAEFGDKGQIDLTANIELRDRGQYQLTSPPAIVKDVIVVGSSIGDNRAADVERGIVRGFDARTGKLLWTWDPIPWAAHNHPRTGAANAWSVISADVERGLVFIPTGSASPDFYGGQRPGDNKWANSVVALRATTGEFVWGFQVVHHDLWDYDVPAQPVLLRYKDQPAVAVVTKMGNLFVLDRLTGKSLTPVEERPVPKSDVPGEEISPTQPFPSFPPLAPQTMTVDDAWGPTPKIKAECREKIAALRSEGIFTPPSLKGSLFFPGNVGGVNWGSAAVDPVRGLLVTNTNRIAFAVRLIPREKAQADREAGERFGGEYGQQAGTPYVVYREPLLSSIRTPCNTPPWGTISALDLNSGKIKWETPLGSMIPGLDIATGSPNLGGPMLTAGGVAFTAAAMDTYLRAFDVESGKQIWKAELPASAQATPMTYSANGKQYVVICAGGHGKLSTKMGDSVVAYTLE